MGEKTELGYRPRQEFAIDRVYQKLTNGIENLSAEQSVDGLLIGADILRRSMGQLLFKFYQDAEQRQETVLGDRATSLEALSASAMEAAKAGDLDKYDSVLQQVVNASVLCKESSAKMKYIKSRGQEGFDPKKAVRDCIQELEQAVTHGYSRLLPNNGNGDGREAVEAAKDFASF